MKIMRPGVKALIVHEEKILMIHERVKENGAIVEITDFPGGGLDFGEGLKDALVREVKEEIDLDVKVGKVVGAWDFVLEENETHIVCVGYQCKVIGNLTIDTTKNPAQEDIYDVKWYTKEELLANNGEILRDKGMIEAVKNLDLSH